MPSRDRDRLRAGAVVAGVVGGLLSGATGDYGDADDSSSRVLSADYAFGVWAPIYAGSLVYAADSLRPSRRGTPLLRRTGWPAAAAYALAGTWVRLQRPPVLQLPPPRRRRGRVRRRPLRGAGAPRPVHRLDHPGHGRGHDRGAAGGGVEDPWPGADAWGVAVLGLTGGVAAAVTRRVPVSRSYPAVVVWGLTAAAVRTRPRYRAAGLAALAGTAGVLLAAIGSRGSALRRRSTA